MEKKTDELAELAAHVVATRKIEYTGEGGVRLEVACDGWTVWLSQAQMCQLFDRDVSVISRHIRNVFSEGELAKEGNLHFLQIANSDRKVSFYSLDVIISVGYRVKSVQGTRFRLWATRRLREILLGQLFDARHIDKLEVRVGKVERGVVGLAAEFDNWMIYPVRKQMGFGVEGKRKED